MAQRRALPCGSRDAAFALGCRAMAYRTHLCALASAALFWLLAGHAAAQASADDKAAAEALFDQGIAHMREGKLEQACGELERSQSLERGIGTMLYLAERYEKLGRTASAWATFREAASVAAAQGETDRARVGASRADRLAPALSRLTLQVPPETRVEGFELLRNGQSVRAPSWGIAVPVDPGEHELTAMAPGRVTWSQRVTVRPNGERLEVVIPALVVDPNAPAKPPPQAMPLVAPPPADTSAPMAVTAPPATAEAHGGWPVQRTIALVVGGVGIVGLGIGGFFGARAFAESGDADDLAKKGCDEDGCDPDVIAHRNDAEDAATLSTVFMVGGGVLAAAGVVLFVTAPDAGTPEVAVRASAHDVRLTMGGAF